MSLKRQLVLLSTLLTSLALAGCNWFGGNGKMTAPSSLSYASPQTFLVGTAIAALSPTVSGTVASYGVSPALPAGLSLNATSGQISGTPTAVTAAASYTITATNEGGSTSFALSIAVNPAAPSALSYPAPGTYTVGTAIAALSPTVTGGVASYSVAPALPAGLSLNTTSGQITGTPTAVAAQASYTITATNAGGSTTFALSITVSLAAPSALSYASPQTYTAGTAIAALNATVTGTVTGFSVTPALPAGLALNSTTGQITGTPTAATGNASYTVTASNATGSTTFALSLTIVSTSASWRTATALQLTASADGGSPRVAADANGNAIAVWTESIGISTGVWTSLYTPAGGWSTPVALRAGDPNTQVGEARVGMSSQGTATVIWAESDRTAFGGPSAVKLQTHTPGGGWSAVSVLDTGAVGTTDVFYPEIAVNAAGNAVAIWQRGGSPTLLMARSFTPGGGWGVATQIDSGTYDGNRPLSLAINASGDAVASWLRLGASPGIVGARMGASTGWATATLLQPAVSTITEPSVSMDAGGNALVGWFQFDPNTTNRAVWTARYVAGTGWASSAILSSLTNVSIPAPQVAIDSTGRNVVAWWDVVVRAFTYATGGSIVSAGLDGSFGTGPRLATDGNGVTTAIWEINVPSAASYKVRSARYSGGSWSTPVDVQSTASPLVADYRLAISANGTSFAVWTQDNSAHTQVWVNVYR